MSSGQWEVVGRGKQGRNVLNGKTKNKDKAGSKIEDVLTNIQIKSFYTGVKVDGNKTSAKEYNKKKLEIPKRPQDSKTQKTQDKKERSKSPRTIEAALQAADGSNTTWTSLPKVFVSTPSDSTVQGVIEQAQAPNASRTQLPDNTVQSVTKQAEAPTSTRTPLPDTTIQGVSEQAQAPNATRTPLPDSTVQSVTEQAQAPNATWSPPPDSSLQGVTKQIDSNELSTLIASNKSRFSNAPLVWLKEIAAFLNSKLQIDVEDPTFPHQPANYPLNVIPEDIRKSLKTALEDAGKSNMQLFFDVTLTAVANDMSRGQSVNGHRLLLQIIGHEHPEFCVESILKSSNLRNSYQNQPPIGHTLLWAFGQGGYHDFTVGLKAWQELFLPIIELKNYSKYIVLYLTKLLDRHLKMDSAKLSQEQFLSLFDSINTKRNSVSKDLSSDLLNQLVKLKNLYLKSTSNKLQVTFNTLMKKLPNQFIESNNLDSFQKLHVEILVDCLERDDSCNATWRQLFIRCSKQSATLLSYLCNNWDQIKSKLKVKSLAITISQYQEACGNALKAKKKDEAVIKANKICQEHRLRLFIY